MHLAHQEALTILADVEPDKLGSLEKLLSKLREDPADNDVFSFGRLDSCHFGRILLLPEGRGPSGHRAPPQLLMLSDCDGSATRHREAIVDAGGLGIDALFGHCKGYPRNRPSRAARLAFLKQTTRRTNANYVHRPGRTVAQIRRESALYDALQGFVGPSGLGELGARAARTRIQQHVARTPALAWALTSAPGIDVGYRLRNVAHAATLPIGLTFFLPAVASAIALLAAIVRREELRDDPPHIRPSAEHVRALFALEDLAAHNGFTAAGFVKPGLARRAIINGVVPLIGWGARHLFTRDSLAGVKTIHFARWIVLDGGRRVVFCSNYDGSLESYNNDFIDLVAWGLNLVFANGVGYPKTRWLIHEGARREQEFKDYLRRHQVPTPIWYSAYPHLTAANVERNAALRRGLSGTMNEDEAQRWLRLL
jgi:hypothetical protein